jgi:hypothetical protein
MINYLDSRFLLLHVHPSSLIPRPSRQAALVLLILPLAIVANGGRSHLNHISGDIEPEKYVSEAESFQHYPTLKCPSRA